MCSFLRRHTSATTFSCVKRTSSHTPPTRSRSMELNAGDHHRSAKGSEMTEYQLIGVQKIGQGDLQYIVQPDITLIGTNAVTTGSTTGSVNGNVINTSLNSTSMASDCSSSELFHAILPLLDHHHRSSPLDSSMQYGVLSSSTGTKHANVIYAELQQLRHHQSAHSTLDRRLQPSLPRYSTPTKCPLPDNDTIGSTTDQPHHYIHHQPHHTLDLLCERGLLHSTLLNEKASLDVNRSSSLSHHSHLQTQQQHYYHHPASTFSPHPSGNAANGSNGGGGGGGGRSDGGGSSAGLSKSDHGKLKGSQAANQTLWNRTLKHGLLILLLGCAVLLTLLCLTTLAHTTMLFGKFDIHIRLNSCCDSRTRQTWSKNHDNVVLQHFRLPHSLCEYTWSLDWRAWFIIDVLIIRTSFCFNLDGVAALFVASTIV